MSRYILSNIFHPTKDPSVRMASTSSNWDVRAQAVSLESEINNVALLTEFGKAAWEEDIAAASATLAALRQELEVVRSSQQQLVHARQVRDAKLDKEVAILEKDLFSYIRNNEKTAIQVKVIEARAKLVYNQVKASGKTTSEIERLAEALLT